MLSILPSRPRSILSAAFLVFSAVLVTGCGGSGSGKTGTVEGTVKVDGVPANSGSVVFEVDKTSISGAIQPDGTYHAIGVPVGAAKVSVQGPAAPRGPVTPTPAVKDTPGMSPAVGKPVPIPPKYAKVDSSGLTFPVKAGTNKYPIELGK